MYSYLSLKYFYDSEGKPLGFTSGSYEYYFRYNLRGDVTGLINASTGNVDVIYEYDAHGNIISKAARTTISSNLSLKNIYLYRGAYGYFYEKNSGLYYLQTRFYDPVVGRFLNADDTDYLNASGTTLGCNLYSYCENDPIDCIDPEGTLSKTSVGGILDIIFTIASAVAGCWAIPWYVKVFFTSYFAARLVMASIGFINARNRYERYSNAFSIVINILNIISVWICVPLKKLAGISLGRAIYMAVVGVWGPALSNTISFIQVVQAI